MRVTLQPRLQVESWSLYWKESMHTDTKVLPDVEGFEVPDTATAADLMAAAAKQLQLRPAAKLHPLPGFSAPWERLLAAGRLLAPDDKLQEVGIKEGDALTYVRVELVAEGWKIEDDLGSDSDDESSDGAA